MKRRIFTLMIIGLVFFISCNNNDENTTETIDGVWHLKSIDGSFAGRFDYIKGEVKWDFNLDNNTVLIENNIVTTGPEDTYAGFDSGTYDFKIIENEQEEEVLFIDDIEQGVIILLDDTLKIDDCIACDGTLSEFER